MIIYPAIDLRQGRCVRLRQGDPNAETVFSDDPVEMARHWVSQGATWLHIVNLDGAFSRGSTAVVVPSQPSTVIQRLDDPQTSLPPAEMPINLRCLKRIRKAVTVPIQFGGGMRSMDDIDLAFTLGANRVVIGTAAVKNPDLVRNAVAQWGADRIVLGMDARDGKVAIHGWQDVSEVDAVDLAHQMKCLGVRRVVYTDISRDGMLTGVNVKSTSNLGDMTDMMVIASGGVASLYDIRQLKRHEHYNIEGVVVGQAIYTGALDLKEAIAVANGPLVRHSAGLLPYRRTAEGIRVLLLWNSFFEQWQFPRGGVEEGESELTCAQREFGEETGLPIAAVHEEVHTTLKYMATIRTYEVERIVDYFLAEIGPGETVLGHDNHSESHWVSLADAKWMLVDTSPEQLPTLEKAAAYFGELLD